MKRLALLLTFVAALTLPVQASAGPSKELMGSDVGTFTLMEGGICAAGSFQVDITGTGNATHVGRYTYLARECFDPSTGEFAGTFTLLTPSGDELGGTYRGTVAGTDDPDVAAYHEEAVISGGTGRFAGVTGTLEIDGLANLATGDYSQTLDGTIVK